MRIYVAAKFEEAARAREVMTALHADGHAITHDWTNEDENRVEPGDLREAYFRECAESDAEGVRSADVVVCLWHAGLQGGLVEIGGAIALRIPVILVGAPRDARCIFFRLCRRVDTLGGARSIIDRLPDVRTRTIAEAMADEVKRARAAWPAFNSAHEGYATLLEEVDELWEHVKMKQSKRDLEAMRKEGIQVGAMAMRFVEDVVDGGRGRK